MRMNISVPDGLADTVRKMNLPISKICQEALQQAVSESIATTRDGLAETLENQARWRDAIAEEYPDDPRNGRSAGALRELAAHVRGLPDDDPLLVEIDTLRGGDYPEVIFGGEKWHEIVDRYGFRHQPTVSKGWGMVANAIQLDHEAGAAD